MSPQPVKSRLVIVTSAPLPVDLAARMGGNFEVRVPKQRILRDALVQVLGSADALIALLNDRVDAELLDAGPRLRIVANCAVGFDNVDVAAATERGILVTNTPDVLTAATADYTFALLFAAARRIREGDRLVRSGQWRGWSMTGMLGADITGQTLGIVGCGRIGKAVAKRAKGFDMSVVFAGGSGHVEPELARRVGLDELWRCADFISLHCPLNEGTRNIVNRDALAAMKPSAFVVNTARGGCIDDQALVDALAAGEIAGAALDVFTDEPEIHPGLRASDRVVLSPHAGSATLTTRRKMIEICATAVEDAIAGRIPVTAINPEVAQ